MDNLQKALVEEVKRFARANYEMDGWDYIVETFSDEDVLELIGKSQTAQTAIRVAGRMAKRLNERRQDIQAEAF